ncbi:MAG: DUF1285 domain-containing protein [Robiginitomaculum sp.]
MNHDAPSFDLSALIKAAKANGDGSALPPVDLWHPEFCGDMDMVIKRDGSWHHEGSPIGRQKLVKLFATILRKDEDGHHYLVTPIEKIRITVERAAFIGVRADIENSGKDQVIYITSNVGDVIAISGERPLRVETEPTSQQPLPLISVRGRLEALLSRPVFYELVEHAVEIDTKDGPQLGVYSSGDFFPLGAPNSHLA